MACGNQSLESRPVRAAVGDRLLRAISCCSRPAAAPPVRAGPAGATGRDRAGGTVRPRGSRAQCQHGHRHHRNDHERHDQRSAGRASSSSPIRTACPCKDCRRPTSAGSSPSSCRAKMALSSQWNSYIYTTVTPSGCPAGVAACDTTPKTQATVESATSGTLGRQWRRHLSVHVQDRHHEGAERHL